MTNAEKLLLEVEKHWPNLTFDLQCRVQDENKKRLIPAFGVGDYVYAEGKIMHMSEDDMWVQLYGNGHTLWVPSAMIAGKKGKPNEL